MTDEEIARIDRENRERTLRHAIEAEKQGRSIAAFYSRKEQRAFIKRGGTW